MLGMARGIHGLVSGAFRSVPTPTPSQKMSIRFFGEPFVALVLECRVVRNLQQPRSREYVEPMPYRIGPMHPPLHRYSLEF
jgi:hypothetical protein